MSALAKKPAPDDRADNAEPGITQEEVTAFADLLADEVVALRRRADEHASLLRSNQMAVGQLTESVAALVTEQRRRDRGINLNSFVAYLLFTILLGAGFYWLHQQRLGEQAGSPPATAKTAKVVDGESELGQARAALAERAAAADQAYRLYQLGAAGERSAVADALDRGDISQGFSATEMAALTAFADGAAVATTELPATDQAAPAVSPVKPSDPSPVLSGELGAGLESFRAGKYAEAKKQFEAALASSLSPPDTVTAHYYLGMSLAALGSTSPAIAQFRSALAGNTRAAGILDVRYQLAVLHDRSGDVERARAAYDRFATEQPQHTLAVTARRRSAALAKANPGPPP